MHSRVVGMLWIAAFALAAADAGARCLTYEPTQVTLSGKLEIRRVPGPPGYQSLARGDLPETIYVLVLEKSVCVSGNPSSARNTKSHAKVEEVQLVVDARRAKALGNKNVRATGELSAGHGRHHRTPVVLTVKGLRGT